jgi:FlaA1/EpsC-like NDP-sugar epimerase
MVFFKIKKMIRKKTILITGGTGSIGKALTKHIFTNYPDIKKLIILLNEINKKLF